MLPIVRGGGFITTLSDGRVGGVDLAWSRCLSRSFNRWRTARIWAVAPSGC